MKWCFLLFLLIYGGFMAGAFYLFHSSFLVNLGMFVACGCCIGFILTATCQHHFETITAATSMTVSLLVCLLFYYFVWGSMAGMDRTYAWYLSDISHMNTARLRNASSSQNTAPVFSSQHTQPSEYRSTKLSLAGFMPNHCYQYFRWKSGIRGRYYFMPSPYSMSRGLHVEHGIGGQISLPAGGKWLCWMIECTVLCLSCFFAFRKAVENVNLKKSNP